MFLSSSERADYEDERDYKSGDQGAGDNQTDATLAYRPILSVYLMIPVFAIHHRPSAQSFSPITGSASVTLANQRVLHSTIPNRGQYGRPDRALALLDAAEDRLSATSSPYTRTMVLLSRAEDQAALGNAEASLRDLEAAEATIDSVTSRDDGFYALWDSSRVAGYRGSCMLALDLPKEASTVLEGALAQTNKALIGQRCAVMTDLATAYAMQREVERSAALLLHAADTAERAGLGELIQRVIGARQHLDRWSDVPAVAALDERLATAG